MPNSPPNSSPWFTHAQSISLKETFGSVQSSDGAIVTHALYLQLISSQYWTRLKETVLCSILVTWEPLYRTFYTHAQYQLHNTSQFIWCVWVPGVTCTPIYWFTLSKRDCQACPKVSNFRKLRISAHLRSKPFWMIQSDLVNWFIKKDRFKRTIRSQTGHHYYALAASEKLGSWLVAFAALSGNDSVGRVCAQRYHTKLANGLMIYSKLEGVLVKR